MWREKSAWYTLFVHAQTIPSIWSFTNLDMNAPRALNCAHQCFVSTHVSLHFWSTAVDIAGVMFRAGYYSTLSVQPCWGEKRPARSASGNLERTCRQRGQSPVLHHLQGMYVVLGPLFLVRRRKTSRHLNHTYNCTQAV